MFYSTQLLSRKTPLGICWLASHLESKRLKRAQVFEVSIAQSCDSILNPEAPLALRLSGQLLLGVVRIYQRKLTFLETDAKNAIDGLQRKEAGTHNVDLPDGGTAPDMAITLPDADMEALGTSELFPSFAIAATPAGLLPAAGGGGTFANRIGFGTESLTLAEDLSDVFGSSRWTASEERFDVVGGDDLDRRFSAELERLRSQAAVEAPREAGADLFYDAAGAEDSFGAMPMDEIMEPPPDDLFVMPDIAPVSVGRTPGSAGAPLPGTTDMRVSPGPSLAFSDGIPDLGGDFTGLDTANAPRVPVSANRGRKAGKRKRRVQLDIDADGTASTQLPSDVLRHLLADRSTLVKKRGVGTWHGHAMGGEKSKENTSMLRPFDVFSQSEAARSSFLYRPACFDRLAPELMSVFNRAFGVGPDGKLLTGAHAATTTQHRPQQLTTSPPAGNEEVASPPLGAESPAPSWGGIGDDGPGFDDIEDDEDGADARPDPIEASQDRVQQGRNSLGRSGGAPSALHLTAPLLPGGTEAPESIITGLDDARSTGAAGGAAGYDARGGFTQRTRVVLEHLQHRFGPSAGSKRPREGVSAVESVSLDGLVRGRSRLEACRWFFEALVLRNKGFVDLNQAEPYGEIAIKPLPRLLEDGEPVETEPGPSRRSRPAPSVTTISLDIVG